jgi:hypothetical protein
MLPKSLGAVESRHEKRSFPKPEVLALVTFPTALNRDGVGHYG